MDTLEKIIVIVQQILDGQQTEADLTQLHELLNLAKRDGFIQGKNIAGSIDGGHNQVGDRPIDTHGGSYFEGDDRSVVNIFPSMGTPNANSSNELKYRLKNLFLEIPDNLIQEAYQKFLYSDEADDRLLWETSNNLDDILQTIVNSRKLDEFFISLCQCLHPTRRSTQSLEYYLLVKLQHCNRYADNFSFNAWLIKYDSNKNLSEFVMSLVDRSQTQLEISCKAERISIEFNECLQKAIWYLKGQYPLTIEVFLPKTLMYTSVAKVDRWKIDDAIEDEIPLGIHYPVRLRSLERLQLNYLYSYGYQWQKSWQQVQENLQNQQVQGLFEHLEDMQDFHWKQLSVNLQEKIGLKLSCVPPPMKIPDLFKAILKATTPIAIWPRDDIPNLDRVAAMNKVLSSKPLCHLCEVVKQIRQEADAECDEENQQHLGLHLAVLWENPYRLTPDVEAELRQVGE